MLHIWNKGYTPLWCELYFIFAAWYSNEHVCGCFTGTHACGKRWHQKSVRQKKNFFYFKQLKKMTIFIFYNKTPN